VYPRNKKYPGDGKIVTQSRQTLVQFKVNSNVTMNSEKDADYRLLRTVARSEGLYSVDEQTVGYLPIFKHPLPVSNTRFEHEDILRKVLSCKIECQAMAAITKGDAWVLEELYMRGGSKIMSGKNGSTPIHLAVQMKSIDCIMVLINIGVDLNVVNNMGFTPLFLAHSSGASQIFNLLQENGAKMVLEAHFEAPVTTVLDVTPEKGIGSKTIVGSLQDYLRVPHKSLEY
jgi:hypothetical protein